MKSRSSWGRMRKRLNNMAMAEDKDEKKSIKAREKEIGKEGYIPIWYWSAVTRSIRRAFVPMRLWVAIKKTADKAVQRSLKISRGEMEAKIKSMDASLKLVVYVLLIGYITIIGVCISLVVTTINSIKDYTTRTYVEKMSAEMARDRDALLEDIKKNQEEIKKLGEDSQSYKEELLLHRKVLEKIIERGK